MTITNTSHSNEVTPRGPEYDFNQNQARKRRRIAVAVGGAVAGVAALIALNSSNTNPNEEAARRAETEAVADADANGGRFYMGGLDIKSDGNVRTEPAIINGSNKTGERSNIVSDRPENLRISDPLVTTNEDGTWFGFPRGEDAGSEDAGLYLWVHQDAIASELNPDLFVEFSADEDPEPEVFEVEKW